MIKLLLILITTAVVLCAETNLDKKHILVLHSYNKSMSWVENIDKAVTDTLKPYENDYILYIEYMDTKRIFSKEYLKQLKLLYASKYKNIKLDLILSSDNNAFEFLKQNRDEIFGNVPTAFSGVNFFEDKDLDGLSNFTGASEEFDAKGTILNALKLYPQAKEIFIINDYLSTGRAWDKTIKNQLKDIDTKITYSSNQTIEELQTTLKSLSPDTIVLLGVYFKDKNGKFFTYEKIGEIISTSSNAPVFCLLEFNLREGVIGGKLIGGYYQGESMSKIGKKILSGIPISQLPVQKEGATKLILDYNGLVKYNMNLENIPRDAILLNKPTTYYQSHALIIQIFGAVVFVLLLLISALLINIKKRKEVEIILNDSSKKITITNKKLESSIQQRTKELTEYKEALFIKSKAVMLLIEPNSGKIVNCNHAAISFYGYSHNEITSMYISDINQLTKEEINVELMNAEKEKRSHFYFKHKIKNGDIKNVEVHTGPINLNGKALLYSIIHDITEQIKQETLMREQSKLASMGEMIGNIAHQWRQPLSVISTASTGIIAQKECDILDETKLIEVCNIINNNAQYLSKTIDDFRNFIKGDRTKKVFNLKDDINSFLHLVEGSAKNHNIQIILNINNTIKINGYENELTQCLINIFNNAKDALNENILSTDNKFLFISTALKNDKAVIKIKDNAKGIALNMLSKIFEPYFTTKHKSQGTGLGLHISYNLIVDGMKGSIEAQNVDYQYEGKNYTGAEFTVTLPLI